MSRLEKRIVPLAKLVLSVFALGLTIYLYLRGWLDLPIICLPPILLAIWSKQAPYKRRMMAVLGSVTTAAFFFFGTLALALGLHVWLPKSEADIASGVLGLLIFIPPFLAAREILKGRAQQGEFDSPSNSSQPASPI